MAGSRDEPRLSPVTLSDTIIEYISRLPCPCPLPLVPTLYTPLSSNSYVFLYGYDGTGYADEDSGGSNDDERDDARDGSDAQEDDGVGYDVGLDDDADEMAESSSSDDDSVLASFDARGSVSESDEGDDEDRSSYVGGAVGIVHRVSSARKSSVSNGGTRGETPPKTAVTSRRKTMFEEMRRESLAGSLQQVGGKQGQRHRRLSNENEESLEKMTLLSEGEEEKDDNGEEERDRGRTRQRFSNSRANRPSNGSVGDDNKEDSDGILEDVVDYDEDHDGVEDDDHDAGSDVDEDSEGGTDPRFLIYFWAGARAKKSDWVLWKLELAKTMIPEWQKVCLRRR